MSTVVDNNKYIINGSTLSEIGNILTSYLGPGEIHYQESYSYYIAGIGKGTTKISFDESYFGISGVQKMKFIPTEITGANSNGGNLYGGGGQPTKSISSGDVNDEFIYTLPAAWQGQEWATAGISLYSGCKFKVFPLDANENVLIPDSATISSKNYQLETTTTEVIQPRTVADIAQSISKLASSQTIYIGDANSSRATPQMIQYSENIYRVLDSRNYQYDIYTTWDDIDPEKILMMWCYYGDYYGYQHLYIRDVTGFMTNAPKSKYFFPNIRFATSQQACQNYNTSTSSPAINPSSQKYYSFSFDTTTKKLYFANKVTAYIPNQTLTTTYVGGLGSLSKAGIPFIIICEN